jgi:glycosyltransferase involved in cell wall biosynthesis
MVVAPTQAMLGELDRYYGPLPRGRMIPNGRNPADYGAAPKEPFVLSAGRIWDEAKNLQALSRAAPGLVWPVSVAGDARHPNGGERPLAGITHLGRLSSRELAGWFARAAIYALPARYEPFGLSILEAALSGCALVLGDLPSLREIWGEAATFVAPDDPLALVQAINHLAAAPAERAESAARSLARARQLTADRLAEGYVEAYGELLGLQPLETLQGKACRKCAS